MPGTTRPTGLPHPPARPKVRGMTTPGLSGLAALLASIDVADPYPTWERLRAAGPVVAPDGSFAVVSSYADCDAILRSADASSDRRKSSRYAQLTAFLPPDELAFIERARSFLFMDAPDHTRLRRLVSKAFTPRMVAQLAPSILGLCTTMLDAAAEKGTLEAVGDLAHPLPVAVISALLGVPQQDEERFVAWSKVLARGLDDMLNPPTPEGIRVRRQAAEQFRAYFVDLAEQRRREPTDDLFSALVAAEEEGDRLSADELVSTAMLLLIAGHETTVSLIGNGLLALMRDPVLAKTVADDPAAANALVDEILRIDPPVQVTIRNAAQPLAIGSGTVAVGGTVLLLLAAAGRDPERYADPTLLDITRTDGGSLALGAGPHYCLGAALARLEGRTVFAEFARRVSHPALETLEYRDNRVLRGPERMEVTFDAILT